MTQSKCWDVFPHNHVRLILLRFLFPVGFDGCLAALIDDLEPAVQSEYAMVTMIISEDTPAA